MPCMLRKKIPKICEDIMGEVFFSIYSDTMLMEEEGGSKSPFYAWQSLWKAPVSHQLLTIENNSRNGES